MMRKNIYWIVGVIVCVALFIGAYALYDQLKDEYAPQSNLVLLNEPKQEPTKETESSEAPTETESIEQTEPSEEIVETAPDFTVCDADGNAVKLSDYFGKPIVLNFWASWCPPCKSEMPHFEEAFLSNPDVQFLMVNMTSGDDMDDAKNYIAEQGYTFPVLFDTTGEAGYVYGASSLPMTIFIDANGTLITYAIGALSAENLALGISYIR